MAASSSGEAAPGTSSAAPAGSHGDARSSERSVPVSLAESVVANPTRARALTFASDNVSEQSDTSVFDPELSNIIGHRDTRPSRGSDDPNAEGAISKGIGTVSNLTSVLMNITGSSKPLVKDRALSIITFSGLVQLRGSRLRHVLRGFSHILGSAEGSVATYNLSNNVGHIDAFISHNWVVSRYKKHLALVVHYNFWFAAIVTLLLGLVLAVLGAQVPLPTITYQHGTALYPRGILCRLTTVPVYMICLLFGNDMLRWGCWRDPILFLDKTCIQQEDKETKKQSIRKLGAFLCHSKEMIVLYTDVYLQRLWTVYEVASFVALHPADRMRVIPIIGPAVLVTGLLLGYIATLTYLVCEAVLISYWTYVIVGALHGYCLSIAFRVMTRRTQEMNKRLRKFDVKDCVVTNEDDRLFVYESIATLMKATNEDLQKTAPVEECLKVFNGMVRAEIAYALSASLGRCTLRFRHILAMALCGHLPALVDSTAALQHGAPLRWLATLSTWYAITVCGVFPLIFAMIYEFQKRCLHLRGFFEQLWMVGCVLLVTIFSLSNVLALDFVEPRAQTSDLFFGLLLAIFVLYMVVVWVVYRSRFRRRRDLGNRRSIGSGSFEVAAAERETPRGQPAPVADDDFATDLPQERETPRGQPAPVADNDFATELPQEQEDPQGQPVVVTHDALVGEIPEDLIRAIV